MSIPGYTAESSLLNLSTRYQSAMEPGVPGGVIRPAQIASEVFNPNRPLLTARHSLASRVFDPCMWVANCETIWNPRTGAPYKTFCFPYRICPDR